MKSRMFTGTGPEDPILVCLGGQGYLGGQREPKGPGHLGGLTQEVQEGLVQKV